MQRQPGRGRKEMRHEREARLEANRIAHEQCATLCPWLIARGRSDSTGPAVLPRAPETSVSRSAAVVDMPPPSLWVRAAAAAVLFLFAASGAVDL